MKLNIGCGYDYRPGWLNLDSAPESAADRAMPAHDLALTDGSVSEIMAAHLVEHLGFFKTRYFLSECWRVLAPGGVLRLETPCIEKTFSAFIAGDPKTKEEALGWVYGSETPGMGHLYCFPRDLLVSLLAESGFELGSLTEPAAMPSRPVLRAVAVKAGGERAALNAALRRRLLDAGLVPQPSEEEAAGLEDAVRRLLDAGSDHAAALEAALISAPAALEYFSLLEENEPRASAQAAAAGRLAGCGLQALLFSEFRTAAGTGLDPDAACVKALTAGRAVLRAALEGGPLPAPSSEPVPAVFTLGCAVERSRRERALDLRGRV